MLDVNLCDNKNQHWQQKLDIHNRCSKCPPFAATQARRRLGCMPFLYLSARWGTSSARTRDGRLRAADKWDTGFHSLVAVAAQQSVSKSCGLYCMGRAQERVYREKIRTVEELQQHITEDWECLDHGVISNAVKQWWKVLLQMADILNICCECCAAFAGNV